MEAAEIINPIMQKTLSYLKSEMCFDVEEHYSVNIEQKLIPYDYTAVIGLGGAISIMFMISYENKTLLELTKRFTYGEVSDDEIEELKEAVGSEIANILIGHSLPAMPNGGKGITITPPLTLDDCKRISKSESSNIIKFELKTNYGMIMLAIIGNNKQKN